MSIEAVQNVLWACWVYSLGFKGACEAALQVAGSQSSNPLAAVYVPVKSAGAAEGLSLIHISEPTRPY